MILYYWSTQHTTASGAVSIYSVRVATVVIIACLSADGWVAGWEMGRSRIYNLPHSRSSDGSD